MTHIRLIAALFCFVAIPALATSEVRDWKSADGKRTIKAELVEQNGENVKLKRADGKVFLFPRKLLSEDDQGYLDALIEEKLQAKRMENSKFLRVFQKLQFGNTPEQVANVMKNAPGIEGGVNEFFKNRMGMNGIFFVKIDGVRYDFFFEFGDNDRLKEISLRSSAFNRSQYRGKLQNNWRKLRSALVASLGSPAMSTELPAPEKLEVNMAQSTDIWDKFGRGYYLGVGNADGGITCVFRSRRESYLKDAVRVGTPAKSAEEGKSNNGSPSVIDL